MSIETTIENINNVYENIDVQVQRIKSNVVDAIDTVASLGKLTLNGNETIENLPTLVDSVETNKSYPNGTAWTLHSYDNYTMSCLEYGKGIWIIGNHEAGKALYSNDGKTWNNIGEQYLTYVKYADGIWVGGGYDTSYFGYSLDGINWTAIESFTYYPNEIILYIRHNGQMWLLVTDIDIYFSYNGINWETCESRLGGFEMRHWVDNRYRFTNKLNLGYKNNFIYRNGRWIGGNEVEIIIFDDGDAWVESNLVITNYCFNGIYQSEDILIAIAGGVWYSTNNGDTWTISNITADTEIVNASAKYVDGMWVIAYVTSDAMANVAYSYDGITWTIIEGITQSQGLSLEYYNGVWFICNLSSDDHYSAYSLDGITWNEITSAEMVLGYNCGAYVSADYYDKTINYNLSTNNDYSRTGYYESGLTFSDTYSIDAGIYPLALYKNGIWVLVCENVIASSVCWEV